MVAIYPDTNTTEYLDNIEREVHKVLDSYSYPNQEKMESLRNLDKTLYWEIIEQWKRGEIPYPLDLRQAFSLSKIVKKAREQLLDNDIQELAFSIAWIGYIFATKQSELARLAGEGGTGENIFTLLVKAAIKFTRHNTPGFTSTDIINNLAAYYSKIKYSLQIEGLEELDLERLPDGGFQYFIYGKLKNITEVNLADKINRQIKK